MNCPVCGKKITCGCQLVYENKGQPNQRIIGCSSCYKRPAPNKTQILYPQHGTLQQPKPKNLNQYSTIYDSNNNPIGISKIEFIE